MVKYVKEVTLFLHIILKTPKQLLKLLIVKVGIIQGILE